VWMVAPDGERSGMSHSITLKNPIREEKLAPRVHAISGSPADCVSLALLGLMDQKPDIVVSGINLGPNLGSDLMYSGTAGAARQAAFLGIPGIALSLLAYEGPWYFNDLANFVANNLSLFIASYDKEHFLNINAPNYPLDSLTIQMTHPCYRRYNDKMVCHTSSRGANFWFVEGGNIDTQGEEGSDWRAVENGKISVSPIFLHPQNYSLAGKYKAEDFALS